MLKFILGLLSSLFGVKDVVKDEIKRTEDISVGVDKKTIADDQENLREIKIASDAGRSINANDSLHGDPENRDK